MQHIKFLFDQYKKYTQPLFGSEMRKIIITYKLQSMKKIKRVDHIFNYSITAILIGGSIAFYCYEKSHWFPASISLASVISGFVLSLAAVQGSKKWIYFNFVIQLLSLSLAIILLGGISSLKHL